MFPASISTVYWSKKALLSVLYTIVFSCLWLYFIYDFAVMQNGSFFFFRATPKSYGSSQFRGWIRAAAASLHHSTAMWDPSTSVTYTADQSNTRSLTHWASPWIKPSSSWILVMFVTTEQQRELPRMDLFYLAFFSWYLVCESHSNK